MDLIAKAQMFAQEINSEAGWRVLTVSFEKPDKAGGPLTAAELRDFGSRTAGWFTVRELFLLIRKLSPSKGEAIATGRMLKAAGYTRQRMTATSQFGWLIGAELDKRTGSSAD